MSENKKRNKKKAQFAGNIKKPMKAGMLCTIDGETFHSFMKNMLISDSGVLCHIANNNTTLYNIANINELVQGSLDNMSITMKGKLHVKVHQVDVTELVHILWPIKYCTKAGANLYSLTCKLSQGNKIKVTIRKPSWFTPQKIFS